MLVTCTLCGGDLEDSQVRACRKREKVLRRGVMNKFVECFVCKSKPEMPVLCESCLSNRETIANLEEEAQQARKDMEEARKFFHKDNDRIAANLATAKGVILGLSWLLSGKEQSDER